MDEIGWLERFEMLKRFERLKRTKRTETLIRSGYSDKMKFIDFYSMSWDLLGEKLHAAHLDKETKLLFIDALTETEDETTEQDLINLLDEWIAEEKKEDTDFLQRLKELKTISIQLKEQATQQSVNAEEELKKEIQREEQIAEIRNRIMHL